MNARDILTYKLRAKKFGWLTDFYIMDIYTYFENLEHEIYYAQYNKCIINMKNYKRKKLKFTWKLEIIVFLFPYFFVKQ